MKLKNLYAMFWRLIKNCLTLIMSIGAAFIGLAAYTNVSTHVSKEDALVFSGLGFIFGQGVDASFDDQVFLIRKIQSKVFEYAPFGEGIPVYNSREPADLMRHGKGLCYDRSRTFDKAFRYVGLESRQVYLLYKNNLPFWQALFKYGQPSHAITEVKTSKGWMFVDSNIQWVAITSQGEPVNADDVWRRFSEFENPPAYLKDPWWAIRGMYSRKGQLYGGGIPFPELSWPDFMTWAVLH
jgi:hypothetical protein